MTRTPSSQTSNRHELHDWISSLRLTRLFLRIVAVNINPLTQCRFLRMPKLAVHAARINELRMCSLLHDMAILEHDDLVTIVNCPEAMRDEDGRARLVFQDAVYILQ